MKINDLSRTSPDQLLDCFLEAFENYFVKMPSDRDYYLERWRTSKVDFSYSYGMFDKGKLVGFIIHALDTRAKALTVYNAGTGVIPSCRGKRITKSIYEYALKDLAQKGVQKSILEVITKNQAAIHSYKSIGFEICKKYRCYNGTIKMEDCDPFRLIEIEPESIDWGNLPNQNYYSWENQMETIILDEGYHFYQVLNNNKPESFFIIKPGNQYLAQFDVINNTSASWKKLFAAIKQISPRIKINNVDERLKDKLKMLDSIELENPVDQYEMELIISDSYH